MTKVSFQFPKYFVKTIDEPRHKSNRLNRESLMYSNLPLENGKRTKISSLIITKVQILKSWYLRTNLVPRALFPGFGGGAPRPQSQGKAPWGRGCLRTRATVRKTVGSLY